MDEKVPIFPSCRASLCLLGLTGGLTLYLLRSNISVAIVCMTTAPDTQPCLAAGHQRDNISVKRVGTFEDLALYSVLERKRCSENHVLTGNGTTPVGAEFDWSRETRGIILSSFSYGYIVTQLLGGLVSSRFGAKKLIFFAFFIIVLATMLSPVMANLSPYALMAMQIIKGLGGGVFFPCYWTLFGKWAPPLERSTLVSIMMSGNSLGNMLAFLVSGFLCEYVSWQSVFYIYGLIGAVWLVAFLYFIYDEPEKHPRISGTELHYLQQNIPRSKKTFSLSQVPWKGLLTSPAVWCIAISEIGFNYGLYVVLTELPQYMADVMHADISQNGLYTALPHISSLAVCYTAPLFADWLLVRGVKTVYVRKLMQSITMFPAGAIMVGLGYLGSDQLDLVLMCLGLWGIAACYRSGSQTNQIEIGPRLAGVTLGFVNTLSSATGTFAPYVSSALTPDGTQEQWQKAFLVAAIFYFVGGVVFLLFAQGEVQEWAKEPFDNTMDIKGADEKSILLENSESYTDNADVNHTKYGT